MTLAAGRQRGAKVRRPEWIALGLIAASIGSASCRSRRAPSDVDAAVSPIDEVYARYKADRTWIDPNDASTQLVAPSNHEGSLATCAHCDYDICYEDLPIEDRLKIESDADLVRMVRWLRDRDVCVRRVAEHVLWPKLGLPGDAMSVSVQDMEGWEYHSIFCAMKARLDRGKAPYDPRIFDGLMVSLTDQDFLGTLGGTWQEDARNQFRQLILDIGSGTMRVTEKMLHPDPQAPDIAWSNKFDGARFNEKGQFELTGESPKAHTRHYLFWPVAKDIVWIAYSNEGAELAPDTRDWKKLRRAR